MFFHCGLDGIEIEYRRVVGQVKMSGTVKLQLKLLDSLKHVWGFMEAGLTPQAGEDGSRFCLSW